MNCSFEKFLVKCEVGRKCGIYLYRRKQKKAEKTSSFFEICTESSGFFLRRIERRDRETERGRHK